MNTYTDICMYILRKNTLIFSCFSCHNTFLLQNFYICMYEYKCLVNYTRVVKYVTCNNIFFNLRGCSEYCNISQELFIKFKFNLD